MIKIGDKVPQATLRTMSSDGPVTVSTTDLFAQKSVVLFGVPGAFTPGCTRQHLPGYLELEESFKEHGVDIIACVANNDAFVMQAWADQFNVTGKITMLSDDGSLRDALGLSVDLSAIGLGFRIRRFAMILRDNTVQELGIENDPSNVHLSAASAMLELLAGKTL